MAALSCYGTGEMTEGEAPLETALELALRVEKELDLMHGFPAERSERKHGSGSVGEACGAILNP